MTAPDTQAPERIDTSRENIERIYWLVAESKAGREVRASNPPRALTHPTGDRT